MVLLIRLIGVTNPFIGKLFAIVLFQRSKETLWNLVEADTAMEQSWSQGYCLVIAQISQNIDLSVLCFLWEWYILENAKNSYISVIVAIFTLLFRLWKILILILKSYFKASFQSVVSHRVRKLVLRMTVLWHHDFTFTKLKILR